MATVLITGTNRGIGLEFVKQYLGKGDTVLATARNLATADELNTLAANNTNLRLLQLEVAEDDSRAAFVAELSGMAVDVFINNAGVYGPRDAVFGNVSADAWQQTLFVNTIAPMLLTQEIIGNLAQGADKKLIYITSRMGSIDDNKGGGSYIYRSSKTALNAVVRSLSVDLQDQGFSVALLHPGWVRTDMGGPDGLLDTRTSVSGMIAVIAGLGQSNTGEFFNYDGKHIAW